MVCGCDWPDPEAEVVQGLRWGRPEWIDTPAYWLMQVRCRVGEEECYRSRSDTPLHEEVCFCLLGGYGVPAELNVAAFQHLKNAGYFDGEATFEEAARLLSEPLSVDGKQRRYRFSTQRAERISIAVNSLRGFRPNGSVREFRAHLELLPGVGPKTSAWVARNWLGSDDVAILDVHVVRACQHLGLFGEYVQLPKQYAELEQRFLDLARAMRVRSGVLDAVMWTDMRSVRMHQLNR